MTAANQPQRYWHPFADMRAVTGHELVLVRGEGATVTDSAGRSYLDATAGLWFANVGHGRAEIADAAAAQMRSLAHYSTFGSYASPAVLALADRLAGIAPFDDAAVFLVSGGSDAVDTAAKMARRYWQVLGRRERTTIVARSSAYHGMNAYGTSLAGIEANASGWGPIVPDVVHVDRDDAAGLASLLDRDGQRIAAVVGEPVVGAGGVYPPAQGYWETVTAACRRNDVLLVADEVVTGYGRLGTWFGSEYYGIEPDIITSAKGVSSGYVPLGAVLAGPRVRDVLWSEQAGVFRHGYTYSGHAAACAAALANLDIIEREDLLGRVRELAPVLAKGLESLCSLPAVAEVRCAGLLGAVELARAAAPTRPAAVNAVVAELQRRGVLLRALVGHSLQLSPAFVITEAELSRLFDVLAEVLAAVPLGSA